MEDQAPDPMPPAAELPPIFTDLTATIPAPPPPQPAPAPTTEPQDHPMPDAAPSFAPQQPASSLPQPRNSTPIRTTNGVPAVEPTPMPSKAAPHGAPARRYLNEKVTGVLLEGMKRLAAEQPENPLRVLGEYLLLRSRELEGGNGGS